MDKPADPLRRALHALYVDHHGWLFAWLRRKLGCPHNAADLSHDTFMRLLRSPASLADLRQPRAYLSTTARRLIIDEARRKRLEAIYLEELGRQQDASEGAPSPERINATLELLESLCFALEGLGTTAREVFLLRYLSQLSQTEIAERLSISERMVRRHLVQSLVHCNQALDV
ncbi:sigma-70 family RNA polymerase sigma factor [Pseudomonas mangiferae]|uniref:Sigma-70 family RNA polymerase sigma factor n=1 Tax=Pseudomonas mangiferae TaxID=2593654 RepID=A0A553GU25_9PSED|nr:sigma-70 family RNA polymerase sigma factor [Pseudomonas mangiferae]TRX73013.1 sigma-70 family RNA polymerase sigma factor [Pseudomonas mangiferae]